MLRSIALLSLCQSLAAYQTAVRTPAPSRTSPLQMGAPAIVAKKAAIVDEVKEAMESSALMFCVRSEGIKVNDLNAIRQKLPESVTMRCVKNTLVKRAAEDFPNFQGGDALLAYSNYWFFVPEDQMRPAVDVWTDWVKETKAVRPYCSPPSPLRSRHRSHKS